MNKFYAKIILQSGNNYKFAKNVCHYKNDNMYREDYDKGFGQERGAEDVFSKPVRAGKRTYFFDVKATKGNNDYYLTITESKRRQERDGQFTFDKHKIFLYKEDFDKFQEGLADVIQYIKSNCLASGNGEQDQYKAGPVEFEDL